MRLILPLFLAAVSFAQTANQAVIRGQIYQTNMLADYWMTKCDGTLDSGTTLHDCSGNGNDGTLTHIAGGANANPTFTTQGLLFDNSKRGYVTLPSAMGNGTGSFSMMVCHDQSPATDVAAAGYQPLVGTNGGSAAGLFLLGNDNGFSPTNSHAGIGVPGSNPGTESGDAMNGPMCVTAVLTNGSNDKLYINDVETVTYWKQTNNSGQTRTQIALGVDQAAATFGTYDFFKGTMYRAAFWSGALTAAQVAWNWRIVKQDLEIHRGVVFSPQSSANWTAGAATNPLVCLGTSITYGTGNSGVSYCNHANFVTNTTFTKYIFATPSVYGRDLATAVTNTLASVYNPQGLNVVIVEGSTNDMINGGCCGSAVSAATTFGRISAILQAAKKAGWYVVATTMLSGSGTGFGSATMDSLKNTYAALMRPAWQGLAHALADWTADPNIGCDGCAPSSGTNTYFSDTLHPNATGNGVMASLASAAVNRIVGSGTLLSGAVVGSVNLTAQTATIGSTALATTPTPGMYEVTVWAETTTAATSGSGCSLAVAIGYTSGVGATSDTYVSSLDLTILSAQRKTDLLEVASGSITYVTTRTAGSCAGDQYRLRAIVRRIQ